MWRQHWDRHDGRRERVFEKGDFKFVLLDLLQEQPGHGYELIRRLEERFGGRYAPSPGVVYPTLQMLEDMGAVSVRQDEGRKVYAITEEGRRFLAERGPRVEDIRERMHRWGGFGHGDDAANPLHSLRDLGRDLGRAFGRGRTWDIDTERARRIGDVIAQARHDIEAILTERPASPPPAAAASGTSTDRPGTGSRGDML